MKLLMLVSDGMEECEALMTRDVLLRGKVNVIMASTNGRDIVASQSGLVMRVDQIGTDNYQSFDGVILPGGWIGTENLIRYRQTKEILEYFLKNKFVATICAAPRVLDYYELLKDYKYTAYADMSLSGTFCKDNAVMIDRNLISARNVLASDEFGFAIIEYGYRKGLLDIDRETLRNRINNDNTKDNLDY